MVLWEAQKNDVLAGIYSVAIRRVTQLRTPYALHMNVRGAPKATILELSRVISRLI